MIKQQFLPAVITRHPQAAHLMMILMLVAGLLALNNLNTQYFPTFRLNEVEVSVNWPGAAPQEIEQGLAIPLERSLRGLPDLKMLETQISDNQLLIAAEFSDKVDLAQALNRVRNKVDSIDQWPNRAERAVISIAEEFEPISKLALTGPDGFKLRQLALEIEQQLLGTGVAKIDLIGLPELELAISVKPQALLTHNISFDQLAQQISEANGNFSGGEAVHGMHPQQLRIIARRDRVATLEKLPVTLPDGKAVALSELATITKTPAAGQPMAWPNGQPGLVLALYRNGDSPLLAAAENVESWLAEYTLPEGYLLKIHEEKWQQVSERLDLIYSSGALGLLLILITLFLFLNRQIAFWTALGIPTAFAATLFILWLNGGSLNMISMFAMLMALGIVVDDAIVIGEATFTQLKSKSPAAAVSHGCQKMFLPVLLSSLTTIAAFAPLMLIGDVIGTILYAIPLVVIAMVAASFFECFAILPSHLQHSLERSTAELGRPQRAVQNGFNRFRDRMMMPLIKHCLKRGWLVLLITLGVLWQSVTLVSSGRVGFDFFPSDDGRVLIANAVLQPDLSDSEKYRQLRQLELALLNANENAGSIVEHYTLYSGGRYVGEEGLQSSANEISVVAELMPSDQRTTSNKTFTLYWREAFGSSPAVGELIIDGVSDGPPDADLTLDLQGSDYQQLKAAAQEIRLQLRSRTGISNLRDNLPYGMPELSISLNQQGRAFGLNEQQLSQQLYDYFTGRELMTLYSVNDEAKLRLRLDPRWQQPGHIESLPIQLPSGEYSLLQAVADIRNQAGFSSLARMDGHSSVQVTASLDTELINGVLLDQFLTEQLIPSIKQQFGVSVSLGGEEEREEETFGQMLSGVILAAIVIYLLLTLYCRSWSWPLIIMATIPLGISGAIIGHWLLQIDLTLLSLFGFFGLAGILINGSIILIAQYREYRLLKASPRHAMELACEKRLRPLMITNLTTIAGLLPLLLSQSSQGEFLKPMATAIIFGLGFGTLLVLILVPSLIIMLENIRLKRG